MLEAEILPTILTYHMTVQWRQYQSAGQEIGTNGVVRVINMTDGSVIQNLNPGGETDSILPNSHLPALIY